MWDDPEPPLDAVEQAMPIIALVAIASFLVFLLWFVMSVAA